MSDALLSCVIADDEPLARARLARLLNESGRARVTGECGDGLSTLGLLAGLPANRKPDVVFLDIEMPALNGLEVARTLGSAAGAGVTGDTIELGETVLPSLVFVTAYHEFALEAFDRAAVDYLVKPVAPERLARTLERIATSRCFRRAADTSRDPSAHASDAGLSRLVERLAGTRGVRRVAVRIGDRYVIFDESRISAIVSTEPGTTLFIDDEETFSSETLDSLCARLDPAHFMRVHRNAIINLEFLKELEREGDRKYTAVLSDRKETRLRVSRERLGALKERLLIF